MEQVDGAGGTEEAVEALLAAARELVGLTARSLADADDLTLPQWRALVLLDGRDRTSVSDLAGALGIHPTTATRLCDRLVAKGLIDRRPAVEDRRQVLLVLSSRGRRMVSSVDDRRRRGLREIVERLSPDQRLDLVAAAGAFTAAAVDGAATP